MRTPLHIHYSSNGAGMPQVSQAGSPSRPAPPSRVAIAVGSPLLALGVQAALEGIPSFHANGKGPLRPCALKQVSETDWACLILDSSCPNCSPLGCIERIHRECPSRGLMFLFDTKFVLDGVWALRAGAGGVFPSNGEPGELRTAVERLLSGGRYLHETVAEALALRESVTRATPIDTLSEREYQVFRGITLGKRQAEIAEELCLSVTTVSTYRRRILEKLSLKGNVDLALYASGNPTGREIRLHDPQLQAARV
ncbi:MAG: hypothetical protein GHCLOJNM_00040 [bacterium]|nr:hypothetical protein [bacterium]